MANELDLTTNLHESTDGIDPDVFGASIFEPSGPGVSDNEAVSSSAPAATPEGSSPSTVTTQNEWDNLPKSWKAEMGDGWKTASPEFRKYVYERETQMRDGISSYKSNADNWNKVTEPFKMIREQYPDADPAQILQTIAQNHVNLTQSTPEQKRAHFRALAAGYGVTLQEARQAVENGELPPAQAEGFSPAQIRLLNERFGPVMQDAQTAASFVREQKMTAASTEVDKFFSDPKNEFVNEVADDILSLMKNGRTDTLAEAYEIAVLRNPEVKARYIAGLSVKAAPPVSNASKLPNVKSAATPRNATAKPQTIDETIAAVMEKYA